MTLLLSTDSVCFRTVVLIFCLPFSGLVQRVTVCWTSTSRSMPGHEARVPLCHNVVLTLLSVSSLKRSWTSFVVTSMPLAVAVAVDSISFVMSILCESSWSMLGSLFGSPGNWIGLASANDARRDVFDMLSFWFGGCSCVIWLTMLLIGLSSESLFGWSEIWMMASFSIVFRLAFAFDWFAFASAGCCCCWAWWGANC